MDYIINEKNAVKFTDISGMNTKTWQKILDRFKYIGYEFLNIDDLKEYFSEDIFLQPDQSREILMIFGDIEPDDEISPETVKKYNQKAKKHFGLTDRLSLAGYILTDGSLLNFSYDNIRRTADHRDIDEVIDYIDTSREHSAAMTEFINYGNIRINTNGIEISRMPNEDQWRRIMDMIEITYRKDETFRIDIANPKGRISKTFAYQGRYMNPDDIFSDIRRYFNRIKI